MRTTSNAHKAALGTLRPNRVRHAPSFRTKAAIRPPSYVKANPIALAEWKAVAPILLAENVLKTTDVSLLASYCVTFARWRQAALDVETNGQTITITSTTRTGRTEKPVANPAVRNEQTYLAALVKIAAKLGLSPVDRPRVELSPFDKAEAEIEYRANEEEDDDEALFNVEIR